MRTALEGQGALLGQHQSQFEAVHRSLGALTASVNNMADQLQQVSQALPSPSVDQTPRGASPSTPQDPSLREPRLPTPEPYAGEPGTCRSFLSQCSLVFQLQPGSFPSDGSKVAYVITLLAGRAREWGTALWDANSRVCCDFQVFSAELVKVFDRSVHGREAARELLQMRQGRRSAADYAIDFRTLAISTGWNQQALYDVFFNGLSDAIQDEVATRDPPSTFDELVELATRIDKRLRQRRAGRELPRSGRTPTLETPHPPRPSLPGHRVLEPMQVDRTRLSPGERQRRRDANACLYCGEDGHYAGQCPAKDRARQ